MSRKDDWRPAPEHRFVGGRSAPVVIQARTEFLYTEPRDGGSRRHAFSRSANLVSTPVEQPPGTEVDLSSAIYHAIAEFGDDADLEIVIRRKRSAR